MNMTNTANRLQKILNQLVVSENAEARNIGTFTSVHKNNHVYKFLDHVIHKNFVDKKAYFTLLEIENVITGFMQDHYGHSGGTTVLTSGSTEAILMALYLAREKAKQKKITRPNVVVSKNAHFSFYRCAKILGVEVKTVGVDDQYKMDLSLTEEAIDKNTVLLVGILGSTELGIIDDVVELDKIAFKHSLDLHLDAAIGGFILPFLNDVDSGVYRFDKLKSLNSINISGHKFGLSLPGCGLLLLRTRKEVDKFSDTLDYLSSGEGRMEGLLVSRSSAGSFSLALNILNYGNNGYTEFARGYAQTMKKLIEYFKSTPFKVIVGDSATPQIFIHGSNIEDLSANLFEKGWIQAPYKPKVFTDKGIRIVIKKDQEELLQTAFISEVESYLNKKTKPSNHLLHESKLSL